MSGIDLTAIPTQLGAALGVSTFIAGLIASAFLLLMFDMPIVIFSKNPMMLSVMTVLVLCIDVALTWLPYFTLVIIVFMLALLFASEMRTWITGRGH
jgi:hypothetical protein